MNFKNILRDPRTNWKYILIVFTSAVLVGGGTLAYQYWYLPNQEASTPTPTPDETADWKTYRNGKFGFQILYPPFLEITSTGPNNEQNALDRDETISGTIQPSYDTIIFEKSGEEKGGKMSPTEEWFRIEIFHQREEEFSEKNYENSFYLYGPCDLRWEFKPSDINFFDNENDIQILSVAGTQEPSENSFLTPQQQGCYYLKNYNKNLIVFSAGGFNKKVDFQTADSALQNVLLTLSLSEPDATVNWNIFSSTKLGISFKYPKKFNYPKEIDNKVSFSIIDFIRITPLSELKRQYEEGYKVCKKEKAVTCVFPDPSIAEKQFNILRSIANTGDISFSLEEKIKSDFNLLSMYPLAIKLGIAGRLLRDDREIIQSIWIPRLNIWGLKLIGATKSEEFDTHPFYYRVVFIKNDNLVELRFDEHCPFFKYCEHVLGSEWKGLSVNYEKVYGEFLDAVKNNKLDETCPDINENFKFYDLILSTFQFLK